MPSRGRDITLNLVTDTSKFDTDRAERDLDNLADSAQDAGRNLRDLGSDAERAERGMRSVGDGADRAARETDSAMGEIRDTSRGAANEMAAGFDGSFGSIIGGLQGMVSEFGMSFGPGAMAGFMIGAAAIGAISSQVTKAKEAVTERVEGLRDRIRELNAAGGEIRTPDLRDWVDEQDSDTLRRMAENAEELGISTDTLGKALYGEADARYKVTAAVEGHTRATDENMDALGSASKDFERWAQDKLGIEEDVMVGSFKLIDATDDLSVSTRNLADEVASATEADSARSAILGGLTDSQIALNEALAETSSTIIDASDDVEKAMQSNADGIIAQAQAMADATSIQTDTWADHLADTQAATAEIKAQLEADNAALVAFQENATKAFQSGGENLVAWANEQADPIAAMKLAAQMSPADAQVIGETYRSNMALANKDVIKGTESALSGTNKVAADAGTRDAKAYTNAYTAEMKRQKANVAAASAYSATANNPWISTTGKAVP